MKIDSRLKGQTCMKKSSIDNISKTMEASRYMSKIRPLFSTKRPCNMTDIVYMGST